MVSQNDFLPDFADPEVFLNYEFAFQVIHNPVFSINNMSDEELRQSIIEDLLSVTMWEKQFNRKLHYGFTRFLHFLPRHMHSRVYDQMKHVEIIDLIEVTITKTGSELRIRDNREILQAAMDYASVWYSGFSFPNDTSIIFLDREAISTAFVESGGVEALASSLTMDIVANTQNNKTRH
jgi:hypothetical protein